MTERFVWSGGMDALLDEVAVVQVGSLTVGRFGGATAAGATQNHDATFAASASDGCWECAAILDAHGSDDSARVVVDAFEMSLDQIQTALSQPVWEALPAFQALVIRILTLGETASLLASCQAETAVLAVARRDRFIAWTSVGDNSLLMLHPELARLGQYQLNQRQFFEWVGKADSLRLPVPCCSSGIRELREGRSCIALVTDGLLESSDLTAAPIALYEDSFSSSTPEAVHRALSRVQDRDGRDSATIVAWDAVSSVPGLVPTD